MKNNMYFNRSTSQAIILVMAMSCWGYTAKAQQPAADYEWKEIARIAQAYRPDAYLSFRIQITYADSATPSSRREEMEGIYQLHQGYFRYVLDSTEMLQGDEYNLVVYHGDRLIAVNKPQQYPDLLKISSLFDSSYRRLHIRQGQITNIADSLRIMRIIFNAGEPYAQYELQYDPRTYRLRRVKYYIHDVPADPVNGSSGTSVVTFDYLQYSTAVINEENFKESRFVYREDKSWYAQAPYTNYRIISTINDEQ